MNIILILFVLATDAIADGLTVYGDGVLVNSDKNLHEGFYGIDFGNGLNIVNLDNSSVYGVLFNDKESYGFYFERDGKRKRPMVRAYYPDYHILVVDAKKTTNNSYLVRIDNEWKNLRIKSELTYKPWDVFLKEDVGFIALKDKPLVMYKNKHDVAGKVLDPDSNYSFNIKNVDGDWVYAVCDKDCEGCGSGNDRVEGWFRWKEKNTLLIDLRYIC